MLTITKQSDYGILLISHIYKKNKLVRLSDLIGETKLPKRFLARIAAELVKSKLLESREGKNGGYLITENVKKISLYDYLKIFNDSITVCNCVNDDYNCRYEGLCSQKSILKNELSKIITVQLKKIKLLRLL
jgi:Rrf2 family protein